MTIMGMLVPVPIVAQVAATFPSENIAAVQMIIGVIPLFMAVSAMLVSSLLAQRVLKKYTAIVAHILVTVAGLSVCFFLHNSLVQVLVGSSIIGIGIGAVQNCTDALIADYFEGKQRSFVMGFYSTFVALGGVLWSRPFRRTGRRELGEFLYGILRYDSVHHHRGHLPAQGSSGAQTSEERVCQHAQGSYHHHRCQLRVRADVPTVQLNVSLLVVQRGFGGIAESAAATTAVSLAGIVAGLIVGVLFSKFKNRSMPLAWCITLVGLILTLIAPQFGVLCAAGFITSLGKETYVPLEGNFAAGNSSNEGRAFNLAIGMAGINFGMALSPLFFEAVSTPAGNTIESKFVIGIVICIALIIWGFIRYAKMTPAQIEEHKRMEAEMAAAKAQEPKA